MVYIQSLSINYLENPVGIIQVPQLSWVVVSDGTDVVQMGYHIQVALEDTFTQPIYDSGYVLSSDSAHVRPADMALKTLSRYFVRVLVKTIAHGNTDWSQPSSFITGIMDTADFKGHMISAETNNESELSVGTYMRHAFAIDQPVKAAYLCTTALGLYHVMINGEKVGLDEMAPGWTSYDKRVLYQVHDVTQMLGIGEHVMGAHVGAGWYKGLMGFLGERNNYGNQTAFWGMLVIRFTDGTEKIIASNDSWLGSKSPVVFSEIYDGEIYDAQLEQLGWSKPGFNANHWQSVNNVPFNWNRLEPQTGASVKVIETLKPETILTTPEGDQVIDFGQNLTGWIRFEVSAESGDRVVLECFEVLDADGNVYLDNLRSAKQRITYICSGKGKETYQPFFTFQGFRYARVCNFPGTWDSSAFLACVVHSDMAVTGTFECSNPLINQLQHNILWGLKGNFLDIPTDCPQRNERLGWTGDAQIFCRTSAFLMHTYTFFSKWLKDLALDQTDEGGVPHVVPDILTGRDTDDWLVQNGTHSAAAWGDAAVINPYVMYLTYGDTQILEDQYESMTKWVAFMADHEMDGIWRYRLQFGDWVALDAEPGSYFGATPTDLTSTAYYAYSTKLLSDMALILGKSDEAEAYQKEYARIKAAFGRHFMDSLTGRLTVQTQTAHVIALYFDLVPQESKATLVEDLVRLIEAAGGHLLTGFIGTPYICHALSENGAIESAYELLLKDDFPSWLYQVKMGATTIWEHWDGIKPDGSMWSPNMNSFNHYAYGAIGEWLYRVVAGIELDAKQPGYKHTIIQPLFGGGLTYVDAGIESIYGLVSVHWEIEGNKGMLSIVVPVNTTASIRLKQAKKVESLPGQNWEKVETGYRLEVGSGQHTVYFSL